MMTVAIISKQRLFLSTYKKACDLYLSFKCWVSMGNVVKFFDLSRNTKLLAFCLFQCEKELALRLVCCSLHVDNVYMFEMMDV